MLVLMLLLHHATAEDVSRAPSLIKNITTCPDIGYFFHRELVPNAIDPGPCHLCFCKDSSSAVCWRRDGSRCDAKNYKHYGKRESRQRRSPGFGDIFFRDAARDIFDKRVAEQCKPFESSFSEGCPPADWCIGCTVCDCDANGRWDCHVLSFCPDKKGKKQLKRQNAPYRKTVTKRNDKGAGKTPKVKNSMTVKKFNKKPFKKPPTKFPLKKAYLKNINSKKTNHLKKPQKKAKRPMSYKSANLNTKMFNKKMTTREMSKKSYRNALQNVKQKNDTVKLAEAIVKRVMSKVERIMSDKKKKVGNMSKGKVVQKRSMQKHYKHNQGKSVKSNNNKHSKIGKKMNKKPWNKKVPLKKQPNKQKKLKRQKRSLTSLESMSNNYVFDPTPVYQTIKESNAEIDLETLEPNSTTAYLKPHVYFRYDIRTDNRSQTLKSNLENSHATLSYSMTFNDSVINEGSFKNISNNNFDSKLNRNKSNNKKWEDRNEMLNTQYFKIINNEKILQQYNESTKGFNNSNSTHKVCGLKNIFSRFIFGLHPNNTDEVKAKVKKINLMSILRSIIRPTLDKKKSRSKKNARETLQYTNVLNALCKNFDVCRADLNDKVLVSKLNDLKKETRDILKIISSIKGLLHFLNYNRNSSSNTRQDSEISKLKTILRDHKLNDATLYNMTDTQRIQVNYIKKNAQEFATYVEKFANTLGDILKIIEMQQNKKSVYRFLRCAKHSATQNDKKNNNERITRLKKLLMSYNLVQNRFMSKMYEALTSLERNDYNKNSENAVKSMNDKESKTVNEYSKNVITNLKRFKNLGRKLSKKRSKREVMGDDDAIEYLLMLMEYLLKQNKIVDTPPVNDGIDLLIDAIKNAPDIKPIKKTILKFKPVRPAPTRTTESLEQDSNTLHTFEEKVLRHKYNDKKASHLLAEYNEIDSDLKNHPKSYVTEHERNSKVFKHKNSKTDLVTEPIPVYINNKNNVLETENFEDRIIKTKYDIYNADAEDEYDGAETTTKKGQVLSYTKRLHNIKIKEDLEKENEKLQNHIETDINMDKEDLKGNSEGKKGDHNKMNAVLDWVEDTIDQDFNASTPVTTDPSPTTEFPRTSKSRLVTRTRKYKDKYANPVSSMSSEELGIRQNKKSKADMVLRRHRVDIFNSLDYNTEKSDLDSDSKEEKNDAFADFV